MVTASLATQMRQTGDPRLIVTGVVVSASPSTLTAVVDIDGQGTRLEVPYMGAAPNAGDVAVLARSANRLWMLGVHGRQVVVPPPPDPDQPPPVPPPPRQVTLTLRPTATKSTRPGQATAPSGDRLVQGDWTGSGKAWGQAVYRTPGITGVQVLSCRVQVKRASGGVFAAQAATLHRMPNGSITGSPSSQASLALPALSIDQAATVALPADWGAALLSGASKAMGIWVNASSPYVVLHGRSSWASSMTVTITYQE